MATPTGVPMAHPATAVKNPDGTWSVRIQHTTEGSVTTVDFTNVLFAEALAKGYAAVLNAKAEVEIGLDKIGTDLGPAVADAKSDVADIIADAKAEGAKLVAAAKAEAATLKTDAETLYASAKTEAATLETKAEAAFNATKAEAEKLLTEARDEVAKLLAGAATKVAPPAPTAPAAETKKVVEEE
jgi:hypothetical protein